MLTYNEKTFIRGMSEISDVPEDEITRSYKNLKRSLAAILEEIKKIFSKVQEVGELIVEVFQIQKEENWRKKMNLTLRVPKVIALNNQVMNKIPSIPRIRSHILGIHKCC